MRFGVCYYPEHWPERRWQQDAKMMRAAGLDLVRIAEFAWIKMEPVEGQYEWDWLDRAIETLANEGLSVILGTPTATPPVWMTRNYPDILRKDANCRFRDHGTRRHYCPNSPRYIDFSCQITAVMAERYGHDERITGWQVDNEFGGGKTARCYCDNCAAAFRLWLEQRYGSISALNEGWGNIFWSQSYQDWEQIRPPDNRIDKQNPSHALDFYRFSSDSYVNYQMHQIDILRALALDQFITTNFMGLYADLDQFDLAAPYDFITWDNYPTGNLDRWQKILRPTEQQKPLSPAPHAYDVGDPLVTGMAHELTRALKQKPFWIMEQQPGQINWGSKNPASRDGTVRLWSWQALAAGANTIVYFRWRPTLFAHEQYHSGLLRHDGEPAVGYRDLLKMQAEKETMAKISAASHEAQVALLFCYDDLWAFQLQPHTTDFTYLGAHFLYYQALNRLGIPVHFAHLDDDLSPYRLIIVPSAHIIGESLVSKLEGFVNDGGTVLFGIRSGFKTDSNLVTDQPLPGALRSLVGATVETWQSLPQGITADFESSIPELEGPARSWVETLRLETAEALAQSSHGETIFSLNSYGLGSVYYLGFFPTSDQTAALLTHLAARLVINPVARVPSGMVVYKRGPFAILLNFTDEKLRVFVQENEISIPGRDVKIHHLNNEGN